MLDDPGQRKLEGMKERAIALSTCLALTVALWPAATPAGGRVHGHHGPHQSVGATRHHGRFAQVPPRHFQGKLHHHGNFNGHVTFGGHVKFEHQHVKSHRQHHGGKFHHPGLFWSPSTAFFSAAPVVYAPPPVASSPVVVYVSPAVYVAPPLAYPQPPPVAAAPPAVEPMATVVEYPTGRYELRGDGMTTPYVWVWIPNPPSGPPRAPEPPASESAPPGSLGTVYRWTDEEGTTFWTNRPDRVPEPYRSRSQRPASPERDPS